MAGGKVTGSDASMREKPSLDASVTATLPKGGTVDIIRTSDDKAWLMVSGVSTKGDLEVGWVQAQSVTVDGAGAGDTGTGAGSSGQQQSGQTGGTGSGGPVGVLTDDLLKHMWPNCQSALRQGLVANCAAVFAQFGITTPLRVAHMMAQFTAECGGGTEMRESLIYTHASQLRKTWPKRFGNKSDAELAPLLHNEKGLAAAVYTGRMGNATPEDAFNFRGRGLIQTTGREGYQALENVVHLDVLNNPDVLIAADHALLCGTAEFVQIANCLPVADKDDVLRVSARVNLGHDTDNPGDVVNFSQRVEALKTWKKALGIA